MVLDPKRAANGMKHPSELDYDLLCDCGSETLTIIYIVNDPKFLASPSCMLFCRKQRAVNVENYVDLNLEIWLLYYSTQLLEKLDFRLNQYGDIKRNMIYTIFWEFGEDATSTVD